MINLVFDFLLLVAVKLILRRRIKFSRLLLGSVFGALSIFLLFLDINSLELFCFKVVISYLMILITFGWRNAKFFGSNLLCLYIVSIVLGGFMYFLNIQFSYKNNGLIFFHNGMSINVIFLLIITPLVLYIYIRQAKSLRNNFSNYYDVEVYFSGGTKVNLTGFVDTGNKLKDPYCNKPIILVEKEKLEGVISLKKPIFVPFHSLNNHNLLKCYKTDLIIINGKVRRDSLIGLSEDKFYMDGIDCILNTAMMEEL